MTADETREALKLARTLQLVLKVHSPGRVRHAQEITAELVKMLESKGERE